MAGTEPWLAIVGAASSILLIVSPAMSTVRLGFLALGTKESLRFSAISQRYKQGNVKEKIWRKMKGQEDMG